MTSAPHSARSAPATGTKTHCASSTTRTPSNGLWSTELTVLSCHPSGHDLPRDQGAADWVRTGNQMKRCPREPGDPLAVVGPDRPATLTHGEADRVGPVESCGVVVGDGWHRSDEGRRRRVGAGRLEAGDKPVDGNIGEVLVEGRVNCHP